MVTQQKNSKCAIPDYSVDSPSSYSPSILSGFAARLVRDRLLLTLLFQAPVPVGNTGDAATSAPHRGSDLRRRGRRRKPARCLWWCARGVGKAQEVTSKVRWSGARVRGAGRTANLYLIVRDLNPSERGKSGDLSDPRGTG